MPTDKQLVAATLAAAIIQVRGVATLKAVREAYQDAYWTAFPEGTNGLYQDWKKDREARARRPKANHD